MSAVFLVFSYMYHISLMSLLFLISLTLWIVYASNSNSDYESVVQIAVYISPVSTFLACVYDVYNYMSTNM